MNEKHRTKCMWVLHLLLLKIVLVCMCSPAAAHVRAGQSIVQFGVVSSPLCSRVALGGFSMCFGSV